LEDGQVRFGTLEVDDGRIGAIVVEDEERPDCPDTIVPGFIDVHLHGGGGADVMDATPEAFDTIAETHARFGTTSWLATTISASFEELTRVVDAVKLYRKQTGKSLAGIHLEGPFLNPLRRGAQNPKAIVPPDLGRLEALIARAEGAIKMITLAPELPGALDVIALAKSRGIVVSAGHSEALWADMVAAASAGVTHLTHLFNAMRPISHREPGLIEFAARDRKMSADFIADGVHLHPETVELILTLFGVERLMLITDAMRATCLGDGEYESAGLHVVVSGGVARIADGTLAGSLLTLEEAFSRMLTVHGRTWPEASHLASLNPARLLGLDLHKGSLRSGKDADLVCLSRQGRVRRVLVGGVPVYNG